MLHGKGEQSSVITEITDQKPKPEPEPNWTALIRSGFGFVFQNPNPTEPSRISHPIYHPTQIQFSESYSSQQKLVEAYLISFSNTIFFMLNIWKQY